MSNPSKQRGTRSETLAVRFLRGHGFPHADRQPLRGTQDQGDILISTSPRIIAEVKARTRPVSIQQINRWWQQTEDEAVNARADLAVLIVHRSGISVAAWDVWMPAGEWAEVCHPHGPGGGFMDGPLLAAPLHTWAVSVCAWADTVHQERE